MSTRQEHQKMNKKKQKQKHFSSGSCWRGRHRELTRAMSIMLMDGLIFIQNDEVDVINI
jgi:hypothetical protein